MDRRSLAPVQYICLGYVVEDKVDIKFPSPEYEDPWQLRQTSFVRQDYAGQDIHNGARKTSS
jgi:hypothetical protein